MNPRAHTVLALTYWNGRLVENVDDPAEFLRILIQLQHIINRAVKDNQPQRIIVDPADDDEL
jgi:hypothetical protein